MNSKRKRVCRFLKGLRAQWSAQDPLSEFMEGDHTNTKISHSSPIADLQINYNIMGYKHAILNWTHNWEVLIEAEFKDFTGEPYYRTTRLNNSTAFHHMDDEISDAIEQIFEGGNMKQYVTTHMTATIK